MWQHILSAPALGLQKQVDLWESEANLVYIGTKGNLEGRTPNPRKKTTGGQNDSFRSSRQFSGKDTHHQAWCPEFSLQNTHGGRRELIPIHTIGK